MPAAKPARVTLSCARPNSWLISPVRPLACRRARSSWSWMSLSSKSCRSSVAAWCISRRLVASLNRSDSSESTRVTPRPSASASSASTSSAASKAARRLPSMSVQGRKGAGWAPSRTTSSMMSLATSSVAIGKPARTSRRPSEATVSGLLVRQSRATKAGSVRNAPSRLLLGAGCGRTVNLEATRHWARATGGRPAATSPAVRAGRDGTCPRMPGPGSLRRAGSRAAARA